MNNHQVGIHFDDTFCESFSLGHVGCDIDAGLLQCSADGGSVTAELVGKFIGAGSDAVSQFWRQSCNWLLVVPLRKTVEISTVLIKRKPFAL